MNFPRREGGQRLRAFVHAHKNSRTMDQLARDAGLRGRQTLNEWFAGKRDIYLGSLQQLADALGVRRVDLVAAYDGVTPPETQKEPPPDWATDLMTRDEVLPMVQAVEKRVTDAIEENRRITRQAIVGDAAGEEILVQVLMEELRPVFEGMARQFRASVEQLLDERLGGSGTAE